MEGEGIDKPLVDVDQNLDQEKLEGEEAKEAMGLRIAEKWPGKGDHSPRSNDKYDDLEKWDHFNSNLAADFIGISVLAGGFLANSCPAYGFSEPFSRLHFDLTYRNHAKHLNQYIKKSSEDKGLLMKSFARELGVTQDTAIK